MWSNMHSFLCRNKGVIIIVYLRVIVTPHWLQHSGNLLGTKPFEIFCS
jgi:hypothetical protein